jgi:hypothetical protein
MLGSVEIVQNNYSPSKRGDYARASIDKKPNLLGIDDMIKLYGHLGIDPEPDVQWGADVGGEIIRD